MGAKFCLVLMLVILGTLAVQGGIPKNKRKNPLEVFARRPDSPREDVGERSMSPCIFPYLPCSRGCCGRRLENDGGNDVSSMESQP